jgi:predicted nuclease with RNAse H fold
MRLGFSLFECAERAGAIVEEVFPSASYRALDGTVSEGRVEIPVHRMVHGPKDMLDATVAAYTVLRHSRGLGAEVGGGDGLGTIVLPNSVRPHACQEWPSPP